MQRKLKTVMRLFIAQLFYYKSIKLICELSDVRELLCSLVVLIFLFLSFHELAAADDDVDDDDDCRYNIFIFTFFTVVCGFDDSLFLCDIIISLFSITRLSSSGRCGIQEARELMGDPHIYEWKWTE
jgi:hypothetical protein